MNDPISFVEAAYRVGSPDGQWLEDLARAASRVFGSDRGAVAFEYDASGGDWIHVAGVAMHGLPPEFVQQLFQPSNSSPERAREAVRIYTSLRVASVREAFQPLDLGLGELMTRFEIGDMIGINGLDPTGRGCVICVPVAHRLSRRTVAMWQRMAAHVAAANRLRKTLRSLVEQSADSVAEAEAVLSPDGRVEHATGAAEPAAARNALRSALVRIERALSRREAPWLSVDLWRGLVSGRWSVVEHFDHDGKRYYLAHRNDPELAPDRRLTPREQQVFAYAGLGHSDKLIAYSLGIAPSTVSTLLSNARRKLGKALSLASGEANVETWEPPEPSLNPSR